MSKIYEALKRAEAERAAGVAVQDEFSANEVDERAAAVVRQEPRLPREGRAEQELPLTPPIAEVFTPSHEPGGFHAENRYAMPAMYASAAPSYASAEPATLLDALQEEPAAATPIAEVDFSKVLSTVWRPMRAQLPALRERGPAVEQFRSLRSRMFEFRDLNRLKSVLVSSGLPREGKSFVAANLAISFARHKASRVLLIDGDMRRSSLHKLLGCAEEPGLATYLAGKASIGEILQRPLAVDDNAPVVPGLASLTFIGGGNDGEQAADLSGNARFKELLTSLDSYFDWIVVDSSPVNLIADGVNLARACDGVLLIARGGVTPYTVAQKALAELKAAQVLGVVLNAVSGTPGNHKYYGYDNYDSK